MDPLRKLLILATNKLISENKIQLSGESTLNRDDEGHIFTEIAGEKSVIIWSNIGFEELRISVWWKFEIEKHPQINSKGNEKEIFVTAAPLAKNSKYPQFLGACASAWLERKDGKHLQGKGRGSIFSTYIRRGELQNLQVIPEPKPLGYQAEGKLYL